jgi:hypothetical protein
MLLKSFWVVARHQFLVYNQCVCPIFRVLRKIRKYRFLEFGSPSSHIDIFFLRLQLSTIYIYVLPPLLTHYPPPSPCQNLSQHTTSPPSSWLARPSNTTHWTTLLYKHTFLTSWHPFYIRPWRWDKQVFPKRWLYTNNWCRATTQKLLSNIPEFAWQTKKSHKKLVSIADDQAEFKPGSSQIQVQSINAIWLCLAICFSFSFFV